MSQLLLSLAAVVTAPSTTVARSSGSGGGGNNVAVVAVLVIAAFVVGAAIPAAYRRRGDGATGREAPPGAVEIVGEPETAAERATLLTACIRARDLSPSPAIKQILGDALRKAGVTEEDPAGQPFDPDEHCSVGVMAAPSPTLDATVYRSERVGYRDHGRQVRPAEVVVYMSEAR